MEAGDEEMGMELGECCRSGAPSEQGHVESHTSSV